MAMFLGHTAFMLELAVFVAGLALWHFGRQGVASALRAGGVIAMVGAALSAVCTGYYLVRYQVQGDLDHAYPMHRGMMHEMMESGGMMKGGGMGPGMMGGMMKGGMGPGAGAPEEKSEAHEEHHPDQATE